VAIGRSSKATTAASPAPPRKIQAGGSGNSTQSPGSRLCSAAPGSWMRQHPLTTRPKITPLSAVPARFLPPADRRVGLSL
jgi:hypothetical protein